MKFGGDSAIRNSTGDGRDSRPETLPDRFALGVGTCGGVGRFPGFPGTAGSAVGIPVAVALQTQPWALQLLGLLILAALAVWAGERAEKILGRRDPPAVVIDEVVGMAVTLSFIHPSWTAAGLGFVFFRGLDIVKPFPARWAEKWLPGGLGVVGDDVVAGAYANILLRVVLAFTGW